MHLGVGLPFRRNLGLSRFISKMVFWSGNINAESRKWLDKTGKTTGIDIVDIPCIQIVNNVTITLNSPATGLTVVKVNEGDDINGITISSGNISITASSITILDKKIWSIELSDGQKFIFQSTVSPYFFSSNNFGIISGAENTDWLHSVSDSAYPYNLVYGYGKYPYFNVSTRSFDPADFKLKKEQPYELYWQNFYFFFRPVINIGGYILEGNTYCQALIYNSTLEKLYFTTRESNGISFQASVPFAQFKNRVVSIKINYNGNGVTLLSSYGVFVNGIEYTISPYTNASEDRTDNYLSGLAASGANDPRCIIINHYVKNSYSKKNVIINGVLFDTLIRSTATYQSTIYPIYMEVPITTLIPNNKLGYNNRYNGCTLKFKMPISSDIFNNDVNKILYTDATTPKKLNFNEIYPSYGGKIHCNNYNGVKDFIITNQVLDLSSYLDGYVDASMYVGVRIDCEGSLDADIPKLSELMDETDLMTDIHIVRVSTLDSDYREKIASERMAVGIHDMNPAFWKYANSSEGTLAFANATAGEISGNVIDQYAGTLRSKTNLYSSLEQIQQIHNTWGFPYPNGIEPQLTDNNEDWWQWVFDAYDFFVGQNIISSFSYVGSLPSAEGINIMHKDVLSTIIDRYSKNDYGDATYIYNAEITNDSIPFNGASNVSVVSDGDALVARMNGLGGVSYGNIKNSKEWNLYDTHILEFKVKYTATDGTYKPLSSIKIFNKEITFGSPVNYMGANYTNPFAINEWYSFKIICSRNSDFRSITYSKWFELRVYDSNGNCVLLPRVVRDTVTYDEEFGIILYANGVDVLIKDVYIAGINRGKINNYLWQDNVYVNCDRAGDGISYDTWLAAKLAESVRKISLNRKIQLFSHMVKDPSIKNPDSTELGLDDRSYNYLKSIVNTLKNNGVNFFNSRLLNNNNLVKSGRINQALNGDFDKTFLGVAGEVWQSQFATVSSTETLASSVDGTNIISMPSGNTIKYSLQFNSTGIHYVIFIWKGNIRVKFNDWNYLRNDNGQSNQLNTTSYKYAKIPIYVDSVDRMYNLELFASGVVYLHKLRIE